MSTPPRPLGSGPAGRRGVGRRPRSRPRWARPALAAVAALVPLVPILVALLLPRGTPARTVTSAAQLYRPVAAAPAAARRQPVGLRLPYGSGAVVALVRHPTVLRSAPGGRSLGRLGTRTEFGSPQALWVARIRGNWLGVPSPLAGNNRLGWIRATDASLSRVDWELRVDLSRRLLTVLEGGRVRERYVVAVGAPASPTPTGRFAVTDRLATGDPQGPYGCCILALSALAPHAIQGWSGGNRIAIHSTPESWTIGQAVSHGCVRLTLAEGRWLIDHVPLGTPTVISSGPV